MFQQQQQEVAKRVRIDCQLIFWDQSRCFKWMTKPSARDSNCPFWYFVLVFLKMLVNFRFFPKFSEYFWEKQWKLNFFFGKYLELKVFIRKIKSYKTFWDRNWYLSFQILPNSTFNFNPQKPTFLWKNLKTKKNLTSEKTWQKIIYKIGVSKSIILEAQISTPTPLKFIYLTCCQLSLNWSTTAISKNKLTKKKLRK